MPAELDFHRPDSLPDYDTPPISEVGFSIQFERPQDFNQMYVRDFWEMFREGYPIATIEPRLAPIFETFSAPFRDLRKSQFKFEAHQGPVENRCVFSSENFNSIIQFQSDRISLNWKKDHDRRYPRFELIRDRFAEAVNQVEKKFEEFNWGKLAANQCELVYSNSIPISPPSLGANVLKLNSIQGIDELEGFQINFSRLLRDSTGERYARVHVTGVTTFNDEKEHILLLNIAVRGRPLGQNVDDCWKFFHAARISIVEMFTKITSQEAQETWSRVK
jgi:uncharacterized protein (TIGR04255 family)